MFSDICTHLVHIVKAFFPQFPTIHAKESKSDGMALPYKYKLAVLRFVS